MALSLYLTEALISGPVTLLAALFAIQSPGLLPLPTAVSAFRTSIPLTLLAAFFFGQSLLFFVEGVVRKSKDRKRGRLRFEPRASAGPVAGGLFLLYSLIVHPLLASLAVGPFPDFILGLPFHGILFTFGLLLFLQRGFPRYVLVVPLAWATLGGLAAFHPDADRDFGLLAGLLAGAFLALPRRKTVPDMEGDLRQETWYEHAARHQRKCGRTLLALLLLTCLIGFTRAAGEGPVLPLARQLEVSFTLLSALLLGLWLSLPAWYSAGFRLLGWEAGRWLRAGRRGWDWLTARWGGVLLLLGLLVYAAWEAHEFGREFFGLGDPPTQGEVQDQAGKDQAQKNLVLAVLALALLYAIYQARRRIIISEFLNHTGEEAMDSLAKGLASRLHNELASITSLYRTIDEAMPPQKGTVVGVSVGVEDVVSSLDDVLGPDSSVKLGKIEIPVGLLFRGLSRLVRGPRLTGGLHREGKNYLVTADLTGGGLSGSWRVAFADLSEEELERLRLERLRTAAPDDGEDEKDAARAVVYKMAEQLAYRIITGLGNLGSPRWEAVRSFTHGLRAYRGTQQVRGDASPELRAAERE
ncbi:MAG TPA: DUF6064 family protein, partial [Thermoanaerobaculia bacterium]|nr:DUF6064 family protein [Thermoanaerobaculia bacterium]